MPRLKKLPSKNIFPEEVCTRTLSSVGEIICTLPLIELASSLPEHRLQTNEPSIVLTTMYPSTSESWRFAPTVSNVMSPWTLSTVTFPESVRTLSSLSTGTVISKSVLLSSAKSPSSLTRVDTSTRFPASSVSTTDFPLAFVQATSTSFLVQAFTWIRPLEFRTAIFGFLFTGKSFLFGVGWAGGGGGEKHP